MRSFPDLERIPEQSAAIGPAVVVEVHPDGDAARIRRAAGEPARWARLAIAGRVCPGATVLVAAGEDDALYVIGLLHSPADEPAARAIGLACGTAARLAGPPDAQRLQVVSGSGQLIFEYDPTAGRTRLLVPPGDLQLVARAGAIELVAEQGIRLSSGAAVEVEGQSGVRLQAGGEAENRSALQLRPQTAELSAPHLRLAAGQLDATAAQMLVTADSLTARAQRTRLVSETLETVVGTLVESAQNIVRRVSGLFQLRAANLHMAVDQHVQVQGGRVVVKADEDVKILGEQIHLG